MKKIGVGPVARGRIDLLAPVAETIDAVADAFGRKPNDITAIVLNRPRHEDLIAEIRETGARIKLIQDGDVTAAISSAIRGTNDHLTIGIGGAAEGVIGAAAMHCLGGELQGPLRRGQRPHALHRHVLALQPGALHRHHAQLHARADPRDQDLAALRIRARTWRPRT
jgi:fructose-1,6-bisphosphatase/sedoheptulose 1,7-bisphosphatase-like protein